MTLAASMSTMDKVLIIALASVGLLAVIAGSLVMLSRRPYKPGRRIDREVEAALSDPAYAPYGADLTDRTDPFEDYVRRAQQHQPCDKWPCPHTTVNTHHCRCGRPWVCVLSGPLNTGWNPAGDMPSDRYRNRPDDERGL